MTYKHPGLLRTGAEEAAPSTALLSPRRSFALPSVYAAGSRGDNWQMIHAMRGLVKAESPSMTVHFEIDAESG